MIMEKQRQPSTTPNPLAGSSSIEFPSDATATNPAAGGGDSAASSPLRVGTTPSGVPNPILDADASDAPPTVTVNFNNTTIAPSPVATKNTARAVAAPAAAATSATSLVPSPLTSPSSSPQHTHSDDVMETEGRDLSCDEPPKKGQRRRSNTVHGTGNFEHRLNYQTVLEEESWQPVNFGDYRDKSPRKDSVGSYASSACGSSHASHDDTYSTQQSCTPLSPPADHFSGPAPTATANSAPSIPQNFSTDNATTNTATSNKQQAAAGGETPADVIIDKRQKRLERNRESARASRRRRKQYLEELENNVHSLSTEMDSGRVHHALESVKVISGLRKEKILHVLERLNAGESSTSDVDSGDINMLDTSSNNALSQAQGGNGNKNINIAKSSLGVKHNVISKTIPPPVQSSSNKQQQQQQSLHSLLKDTNVILETSLSRTQPSFQVVNTFLHQQLKSLILTHKQPILSAASSSTTSSTTAGEATLLGPLLPSFTPFLLWLTLQNDNFFRGGRAQSERLSAARIGERLLHGGLYRVTPSTTAAVNHNKSTTAAQQQHPNNNKGTVLWPLLCNEIGLSYDQEDKIRTSQRLVLQNVDLWIHRHTARATANVIQSIHDVIGGMTEKFDRKKEAALKNEKEDEEVGESSLLRILTEEQKIKFLGWAMKNQERMKRCAERNVGKAEMEVGELEVSTDRHAAANMYIIDHRLSKIKQRVPQIGAKYVHPLKLKNLGRRPCFESLGGNEKDNDAESTTKMSREKTFPSTGSLKRSLDEMSIDGTSSGMETNLTAITPVAAQAAGHAAASSFLKDVLPIIPKPSIHQDHLHMQQQNQQLIHHEYNFEPEPVVSSFIAAPVMSAALPSQPQQQYRNTASSSFDDIPMPTPVSVLLQTPDDLLAPIDGGVEQIMGVDPTALAAPDQFTPEAVPSSSMMVSRHQSAPEFRQYINNSSAPVGMVPVPEERTNDEDDFFLDDLPMDADDWLVGDDSLQF